jgi:hypothetical protein
MAKRNKQTGTPSSKDITRKGSKATKIKNPWGGPNIPKRNPSKRANAVSGSSRRQAKSAPELAPQTKGYPANQPSQWPVVPDYAGHTRTPSLSGVNTTTAASHNAAVEHAYTRAKYQSSP